MSNCTIDYNADATLDTTIAHATLPAGGLAGATGIFYVKRARTDPDASALFSKTPSITTVGSSSVDGVMTTQIAAADTANLPRYTTALYWRLVVTDSGGVKSVPDEGLLIVRVG